MMPVPNSHKPNPTMNDVAELADVSVATVSRVVNKSGTVSPALERRVRDAMEKLNYYPSSFARGFKRQQTNLIGVLVPLLEHPFYSRLATSIEQTLFAHGYWALICNSQEDEAREQAYIDMLLQQRVDGVIINSSAQNTEYLKALERQHVPFVFIDRNLQAVECSKVFSDNSHGGYMGMEHLIQLGHRRIGVVGAPTYPELMQRRIRGTREALMAYGIDADPELLITSDSQQFDMGYTSAKQLLHLPDPPTAIFALTDVMAVGVLHAAAEMHLRVPEDLSVLGYDDIPIASYTIPPLTTVAQPIIEMGQTCVELLLHHVENPGMEAETAVLETHLVVRNTTAPPKHYAGPNPPE